MLVTARKWRPQFFKDFVGQEQIIRSLENAIQTNNIGHAYLFSGPRGVGKTSAARVFAKALNCLENGVSIDFCGKCKSCVEITNGISVDVIEIDAASNRGIDKIRELRDNVQFLPAFSRYKIYIIDEVHMLTNESFNALLKTLEEPPSHVIFLLATTEPHKVKITIRSRCRHLRFKRITIQHIVTQLGRILEDYQIPYEKEALFWIAKAADGSMRDSQSLLDQVIIYCGDFISLSKTKEIIGNTSEDRFFEFLTILLEENVGALDLFIQRLLEEGEDISFFAENTIKHLRHLLLVRNGIKKTEEWEEDYIQKLEENKDYFNNYQLQRIIELFFNLHKDLKNTENEKFLLEHYLYQALEYRNFVHLPSLISRLTELEKKLLPDSQPSFLVREYSSRKQENRETKTYKTPVHPIVLEEKQEIKKEPVEKKETPEGVWQQFKLKVLERNPKWSATLLNVKSIFYQNEVLEIEFLSFYEAGFFQEDKQLISQIKDFFAKFKLPVKEIKTKVLQPDFKTVKNPVAMIKEYFKGEEI